MRELEKAKETERWLLFFNLMVDKVHQTSTDSTFKTNLQQTIKRYLKSAQEIILKEELK